jgi:hypothetical protein
MTSFKKMFGHERSESRKTLDRLTLSLIIVAVLVGVYACHD